MFRLPRLPRLRHALPLILLALPGAGLASVHNDKTLQGTLDGCTHLGSFTRDCTLTVDGWGVELLAGDIELDDIAALPIGLTLAITGTDFGGSVLVNAFEVPDSPENKAVWIRVEAEKQRKAAEKAEAARILPKLQGRWFDAAHGVTTEIKNSHLRDVAGPGIADFGFALTSRCGGATYDTLVIAAANGVGGTYCWAVKSVGDDRLVLGVGSADYLFTRVK